jgi:hypothetical protein
MVMWAALGAAQNSPTERTVRAPRLEVQKALRSLPGYAGGKLPVLVGFADGPSGSLDNYKRGFYQYEVQTKAIDTNSTLVRVTAKITAWYSDASAEKSGYRVLKSSGRLESDLLDALEEKLNLKPAGSSSVAAATSTAPPLPDSPSASGSYFNIRGLKTAPSSDTKPAVRKAAVDPATGKKADLLRQQADDLEKILHNQTRPADLAVVKRSNTPVVSQPLENAEVLFQADAEDEFQVLDAMEGWVHVQISGLSRGWIRRDFVDLPGAATISLSAREGDQRDKDLVRETKEETGMFPGKWDQLNGKQVKIIWVQPLDSNQFGTEPKWTLAKSVFRKADAGAGNSSEAAGVVVIFDSEDGGMAATTIATLQQWRAGHLADEAFWKRSWRDPAEAFQQR